MEMSAVVRIFTMFLLCTLLLASQQRAADASGIQQPEQQQEQQLNSKAKKSLSNWVQSYKEPKQGGEQQKAAEQEEQEELSCTIKVQKVEKHTGKCVRLRGGATACQTDTYLDPVNADCMFLED